MNVRGVLVKSWKYLLGTAKALMSGSLVKVRYWDGWILGVRLIMLLLKMVVVIGEVALVVGKGGAD
jgi:hypothetical protein